MDDVVPGDRDEVTGGAAEEVGAPRQRAADVRADLDVSLNTVGEDPPTPLRRVDGQALARIPELQRHRRGRAEAEDEAVGGTDRIGLILEASGESTHAALKLDGERSRTGRGLIDPDDLVLRP